MPAAVGTVQEKIIQEAKKLALPWWLAHLTTVFSGLVYLTGNDDDFHFYYYLIFKSAAAAYAFSLFKQYSGKFHCPLASTRFRLITTV